MNFSTKNAFWILQIIIVLAISGWYFASNRSHYTLDEHALNVTVDNRIINLTLVRYDSEGNKIHQLKTPLMTHIPYDNTNYFTQPRIIIVQENQAPWKIQAAEGTSLRGGEKILLRSQVVMEQFIKKTGEKNRFITESLDYFPQKKIAQTDAAIHYEQPGAIVESLGMRAWLEEKRIQLLHRARGKYEPAHT